jgi:hypothetical protein
MKRFNPNYYYPLKGILEYNPGIPQKDMKRFIERLKDLNRLDYKVVHGQEIYQLGSVVKGTQYLMEDDMESVISKEKVVEFVRSSDSLSVTDIATLTGIPYMLIYSRIKLIKKEIDINPIQYSSVDILDAIQNHGLLNPPHSTRMVVKGNSMDFDYDKFYSLKEYQKLMPNKSTESIKQHFKELGIGIGILSNGEHGYKYGMVVKNSPWFSCYCVSEPLSTHTHKPLSMTVTNNSKGIVNTKNPKQDLIDTYRKNREMIENQKGKGSIWGTLETQLDPNKFYNIADLVRETHINKSTLSGKLTRMGIYPDHEERTGVPGLDGCYNVRKFKGSDLIYAIDKGLFKQKRAYSGKGKKKPEHVPEFESSSVQAVCDNTSNIPEKSINEKTSNVVSPDLYRLWFYILLITTANLGLSMSLLLYRG